MNKKLHALYKGEKYIIKEDYPEVGWYIYHLDKDGNAIHDYLQDTIEIAIEFAEERFGVPKDSWK